MSSSSFNVIRRHSIAATSVRFKELTQQLAKQRSDIAGSQLETDDVRSQGRMDHSTIKVNDERLKFVTKLTNSDPDFNYEFPNEPDHSFLKVWFMLDHLGAQMRDMSGFGNDAYISGHPTLRRVGLDLGFQQTAGGGGTSATPVMLFNSGTDVVSQKNGEYVWIPDNPSVQFIRFSAGFSITCRFSALSFYYHIPDPSEPTDLYYRRIASKSDDPSNGWNLVVYPTNSDGTQGGIQFEITDNGVKYLRKATGYSAGSFYQLVITYNPNAGSTSSARIKMYTAGIENSSDTTAVTTLPPYTNLRIGASSSVTGFFYGYIHDFRLYMGKVLTQTETTNINQNELTIDNITKNHVFIVQYAFVSTLMRRKTHKYNIGGDVKRDKIHKFNILTKITRARIHKYSLITSLTRTRTHKYNLVTLITRTRTHRYQMEGVISVTKTHKYNIIEKLQTTRTHKYYVGGLQSQYKRFQKSTTVGSNVIQDIVFNGKPQALIVWSNGSTADNTLEDAFGLYYGFSDGTNNACVSGISLDAVATSDTFSGIKDNKVISLMTSTPGTMTSEASVSFIDTNTARFTWSTNDNRATYIHCLALWGINNVEVKTFTTDTTATGNTSYSLNKSHLNPKFIHTVTNGSPLGWSTAYGQCISIGAASTNPSTKQFSVGTVDRDAQATMDTVGYSDDTNVVVGLDDDSVTAADMAGTLSSVSAGSFTINWTNNPTATNIAFAALVLDSNNVDAGTFLQPTATGNQTTNTTANVDAVKSLMLFTNRQATTGFVTPANITIGGASGTGAGNSGMITAGTTDNATNAEIFTMQRSDANATVIKNFSANPTASLATTVSEAWLNSLGTDQFTLNWQTVDATQRRIHYIVFGNSGTDLVSTNKTHKYHVEGPVSTTKTHKYNITDSGAPTITDRSPAPNATGVSVSANIVITFSEAMDSNYVGGTWFQLRKTSDMGTIISASETLSPNNVVTINPTANMDSGTSYTMTVVGGASGVRDLQGTTLAQNVSWSFTTA